MFFHRKKIQRSVNRRANYRKRQSKAYSLSVHLVTPSGVTAGEFLDLSMQGVGASFLVERDPRLVEGDVVELSIQSLSHGAVTTPARVVYGQPFEKRHVRYGFEFINAGNLYSQLDSFYARLFNRRKSMRVRPALDRKVHVGVTWGSHRIDAVVGEISATGVGLIMNEAQAAQLMGVERVGVVFRLPGLKHEFHGHAEILNRKATSERVYLGLAFDLEEPEGLILQQGMLEGFVDKRSAEMERWESSWS